MSEINERSIQGLLNLFKDDPDGASFIRESLQTFSTYAAAIFRMETYMLTQGDDPTKASELSRLDESRSRAHDAVIASIENLNYVCEKNNIPPIYNGTVARERPYRVEIADAVLLYVQKVMEYRTR